MNLNNGMSQEEHISLLQQHRRKEVEGAAIQINNKYEKYVNGEEDQLEEILEAVDIKYRRMVIYNLYKSGCYNDENEHTALQEARTAVWIMIQESKKNQEVKPAFLAVCKSIYYYKAMDVIRAVGKELERFGKDYVDPKKKKTMKETEKNKKGVIESLDKPLPSGNGTVGSLLVDSKYNGNQPEKVIGETEKREFFDKAFVKYCYALVHSDAEPPRGLALYYSRILPHILHIYFSIETIPDEKTASPKWAIEKMGSKTIGILSEESENQLKEYVSEQLEWCDIYRKQLDNEVSTFSGMQVMRNIIYVDQYDEDQIGHMTDYMHKILAREWLQLMKKEPKAIEKAIDYTVGLDRISKILRGGLSR